VLLDDLHWADRPSLDLLQHVSRYVVNSNILLVFTYRDTDLSRGHPLDSALASVRRERNYRQLRLRGLGAREIASLVEQTANAVLSAAMATALARETSGNPFFVEELARHLSEEEAFDHAPDDFDPRMIGVPDGVRQIVRKRIERLSPDATDAVMHAAVFTHGIDFQILETLTGQDEARLLDSIDEALRGFLIAPVPGYPERYDFVHAIVRRALYDEWNPTRRVRLHRRLAEALVARSQGPRDDDAAEIAAQFRASVSLPGAEQGIAYAIWAADQATRSYAPDQAAAYLRIARDLSATASCAERVEVLTKLAIAEANALQVDDARATIEAALCEMAAIDTPTIDTAAFLSAAAAALKDGGAPSGNWEPIVERGLAIAPPGAGLIRARLALLPERFDSIRSGRVNSYWRINPDPATIATARQSGDEQDYARSLQPFDDSTREDTERLIELTKTWRHPTAIVRGIFVAGADLLYRRGDFRGADALFRELLALSERYGAFLGQTEANIRLAIVQYVMGRFAEAQDLEARARDLASRYGLHHRFHASLSWIAGAAAEYLDGDWAPVSAHWTRRIEETGSIGSDDAGLYALALARTGETEAAHGVLNDLATVISRTDPRTPLMNGAVDHGGSAVWALGDRQLAAPFRTAAKALIDAGHGDFPGGSHELTVARMATLLENASEAATYYRFARQQLEHSGQRPLLAIAVFEGGTQLVQANLDRRRGEDLVRTAKALFDEMGMPGWAHRVDAAAGAETRPERRPGGLTEREIEVVRLVARGQSDRQIGDELYVSPRTVNAHIRNILGKTDCGNRTELSVWAFEHGLIQEQSGAR
jgi:DNA-binding CsgD family transcriptional regulator